METESGPIKQGAGHTRPREVQPNCAEISALGMPANIHHPNPQSGLIEIITRQTYEEAGAGRRVVRLIHKTDEDCITDKRKRHLLVERQRCSNRSTSARGLILWKGTKKSVRKLKEQGAAKQADTEREEEGNEDEHIQDTTIG